MGILFDMANDDFAKYMNPPVEEEQEDLEENKKDKNDKNNAID